MQSQNIQSREAIIELDASDSGFADLHPVIQRVLLHRNINQCSETKADFKRLLPPDDLKGITRAAERIADAITSQQSILIVGDYDADGATASVVAIRGLLSLGAKQVKYKVPNRFHDGYGLSLKLAQEITSEAQPPQLVITVDNGISSLEGIARLNQAGIDVIVTDHHLPGESLPAAYAIVNPNQPGCGFSSKAISGVGVMFYVLLAVRSCLRAREVISAQTQPNLAELLDLVALGTVADVVPLDQNNRILVAKGIERMRAGLTCAGITAILRVARCDQSNLLAQNLGFVLGPRLNASGRLDDISAGIECLLADDPLHAEQLAQSLDSINRERKQIEQAMQNQALAAVKQLDISRKGPERKEGLVLFDEAWHEGVVGLVASRIKDKAGVPVLVFARGEDGLLKGSARSVPEVHIRDVLANIDARNPSLIVKFGGHAMAAGLSITGDQLELFRDEFAGEVASALRKRPPSNTLLTDGSLQPEDYNLQFASTLQRLLPWGQGCPEPLFEGVFEVLNSRFVGEMHLKMVLRIDDRQQPIDAICFRYIDNADSPDKRAALELMKIRAVYSLDVNRYRGKETLQLLIRYMEAV